MKRVSRLTLISGMVGLLASSASGAEMSAPQTFDNPASIQKWQISNGPEYPGATGSITHVDEVGHDATGALALNFDFSDGGNYVAAITDLPTGKPVKAVRLWLNKQADNLLIVRAVDAKGETFQKDLRYHYPGWQELEITLADFVFSWSGDSKFDQPPTEFHLLVENQGDTRVGRLLMDDVRWVYERDPLPPNVAVTTYVESRFEDGWNAGEHPENKLTDGVWHYHFNEQFQAAGLHYGRSALARPQTLQVTVISDGSGHTMTAAFGSHFQRFEREIGTLDEKGKVTFTVPMGDMSTWEHYGGQDDGIVRYPLRLENVAIKKTAAADTGQLEVVSVAFETAYDQTRPGALVPTVTKLDNNRVEFNVQVRSLVDKPVRGELLYSIKTVDRTLKTGRRSLEVPALGKSSTQIPYAFDDHTVLEGEFEFVADQIRSGKFSTTIAKPPPMPHPPQLDPESRVGVGMYLYRFHQNPDAKQWMTRMCKLAAAAGVRWTREEFHWNWVETAPDQYDWSFFDQLVDTAYENGISIYGLVCYWTAWDPAPPFDDEFVENYCDYLRKLVGRYKGRIKHWEIWNEPNIFFWPGDKDRYAVLLKRAYETIKEVDPDAEVLGVSTAGIDISFIERVVNADAPMDALTVHPYRHDLDVPGFIRELERSSAIVGNKPVWITEMGWPSNIGGYSERQQAGFVARTYIGGLAAPAVRSVAWYNFREDGTDPFYNEHHFGLIRHKSLDPKMGYRALATVGNLLQEAESATQLDTPDDLYAYRFDMKGDDVIALWSEGRTRLVALDVSPEAEIVDLAGDPAPRATTSSSTYVRLQEGLPIYLVGADVRLSRVTTAVELIANPGAIHPGDQVRITWNAPESATVALADAPHGWKIVSRNAESVTLAGAEWLPEGSTELPVEVTISGETFPLSVELPVVPPLLVR